MKMKVFILGLLLLCSFGIKAQKKPNVLFIAVDDLRTDLNCYGSSWMKTPNIDRLANQGILFKNAYAQEAICAPSRNSIMTGLRPDAMGIYDLSTFFRTKTPDVVTLPQHFKRRGYVTENVGKIFHTGNGNSDDSLSWSTPKWSKKPIMSKFEKISRGDTTDLQSDFPKINGVKLPYYCSDAPEEQWNDAVVTQIALQRLEALKDTSFFMAVGYIKPHLPFVAPRKYWNMYNPDEIEIPERQSPEEMPPVALHNFEELRNYYGIPSPDESKYLSDETTRNLIHGYRACVSMIDNQIGQLLNALDSLGLSENTIIVLWGDHGWKLGEYGSWCKHTNFELDTRVPLIISASGYKQGGKTKSLAELVDVYPTLCELAGLELPSHLEGQSLVPILENLKAEVNTVAISQYPMGKRLGYDKKTEIMGYSVFDGRYRFTRWQYYENPDKIAAKELYDHKRDRVAHINLAYDKKYATRLKELEEIMNEELKKYRLLKSTP